MDGVCSLSVTWRISHTISFVVYKRVVSKTLALLDDEPIIYMGFERPTYADISNWPIMNDAWWMFVLASILQNACG